MAVISKVETVLPNRKRFMRVVKYLKYKGSRHSSLNEGFFQVDLPDDIYIFNEEAHPTGKTEKEALTKWDEVVDAFFKAKKVTKTLIILKFEVSGENGNYFEDKFMSGDGRFAKLLFSWGVYISTQLDDKITFKFNNIGHKLLSHWDETNPEHWNNEYKVIDWTEQRQKWFETLEAGFINLLSGIEKFLSEFDNEKLAKAIDKGSLKLLNNSK